MSRALPFVAASLCAALLNPAFAAAAEPAAGPSPLRLGVSLVGLVVAVVLLLEALAVRKVALGGAIAERISYVILAIVCLAASAVAQWTQNFVQGITLQQTQLASELLVIVAMALLAAYFYSVRSAMQRYLKSMTGGQQLDSEDSDETEGR